MKYTVENKLHGKIIVQTVSESVALQTVLSNKNCVLDLGDQKSLKKYPQIPLNSLSGQTEFKKYTDIYNTLYNFLIEHNELNLFHNNSIIGHGRAHAQRVGVLSSIICFEEHVDLDMTILIIFGAIIHDVGRNQSNLFNNKHGEESVRLVKLAIENKAGVEPGNINRFFHTVGLDCDPSDEMITALFGAISVHCKDAEEWNLMQESLPSKVQSKFRQMANIIEDSDALDRVRFSNNLEINYLRLHVSRCLIYSAGQLLKQGGEIGNE